MSSTARELGVPSALQVMEEAFHVLRRTDTTDLLVFYAGTVPFVLDLLYYTADRTRTGRPGVGAALGAGALYLLMKIAQGRFARSLRARLGAQSDASSETDGAGDASAAAGPADHLKAEPVGVWRHALAQIESQPWSLFLLPLAFVLTMPFGWVYAYYQSLAVVGDRRAARRHAAAWPRQNHVLILLLTLLGTLAFLNSLVLLLVLPGLLRALVGWQGAAAIHPGGMWSMTTVAVAAALAYLATAPLARAAYALRCFYFDARGSGDDLRAELTAQKRRLAAALTLGCVLVLTPAARAEVAPEGADSTLTTAVTPTPTLSGRARELDAAATRVLERREFAWRLPRAAKPEEAGFLARFVQPIVDATTGAVSRGVDAVRAVVDWLARKLRVRTPPRNRSGDGFEWIGWTHVTFALAAIVVIVGALLLIRRLRRRAPKAQVAVEVPAATLDVATDDAAAAALPTEQWVSTARRLLAAGDARGAVRAAYLAGLALLAQRELLTPVRSKSNREYLLELARRTRDRPDVPDLFAASVEVFERVWYGRHVATADLVAWSLATTERLAASAGAAAHGGEHGR